MTIIIVAAIFSEVFLEAVPGSGHPKGDNTIFINLQPNNRISILDFPLSSKR